MPTLQRAQQLQQRQRIPRARDHAGHLLTRASIGPSGAQLRADTTDEAIGFKGHAIVFNTPAWIGSKRYGFWEQIAPEAVVETIASDDIRMLKNHNPDLLLARTTNDTLRLDVEASALAVDADMAPTTYAKDLAILLGRGDLNQMSFAFEDLEWTYTEADDGEALYTLTKIRMFDVAPVTYPAYVETDAGLRARTDQLELTPDQLANALRAMHAGELDDPDLVAAMRSLELQPAATPPAPASTEERTDSPTAPADTAPPPTTRETNKARTRASRHGMTKETI